MHRWVVIGLASILGTACVTTSTHERLQRDRDATAEALSQERAAAEQARAACAAEREAAATKEAGLARELAAASASAGACEAALKDLEARHAASVQQASRMKASAAEMAAALEELRKSRAAAEARVAQYRDLLRRFQTLIDAGQLKVRLVRGRMVVELATDVLFASGSAKLSEEGRQAITAVSGVLVDVPVREFRIAGHTDTVPISNATYSSNWELASARALSVVKTMLAAGMPATRVSAASYGEHQPATGNATPEERRANRRIEIEVVPDLSDLPGVAEMEAIR